MLGSVRFSKGIGLFSSQLVAYNACIMIISQQYSHRALVSDKSWLTRESQVHPSSRNLAARSLPNGRGPQPTNTNPSSITPSSFSSLSLSSVHIEEELFRPTLLNDNDVSNNEKCAICQFPCERVSARECEVATHLSRWTQQEHLKPPSFDTDYHLKLAGGVEFGAASTGGVTSGAWKIDNQDAFIVSHLDLGIMENKKEKGVGWGWKKMNNNNNNNTANSSTTSTSAYVVGVLDGHGRVGKAAALQAKDALLSALQMSAASLASSVSKGKLPDKKEYERWMERAFQTAAATLLRSSFDFSKSGTTAVVSLIDERGLTVAWAGDSRAVLGVYTASINNDSSAALLSAEAGGLTPRYTKPIESNSNNSSKRVVGSIVAIPLTEDHRPERKSERERILSAGGRVGRAATDAKGFPIGPLRVFRKDTWVPGLAVTRAIGDHIAADAGVIPTPEVRHVPLDWHHHHDDDESSSADSDSTDISRHVLVLASDGVWEWLSSSQVVKIAAEQESADAAAAAVVEAARKEWAVRYQGRHCDDVTATVVFLPN